MRISLITLCTCMLSILFSSCSGYRLGATKPTLLQDVQSLSIPIVKDRTQNIKLAARATNALVRAINQDGTYRVTTSTRSDATLEVSIDSVSYSKFRATRYDTLRAQAVTMIVNMHWNIVRPDGSLIMKGRSTGKTRYYLGDNQRLSRENALPNAVEDAAQSLTSEIANGFTL